MSQPINICSKCSQPMVHLVKFDIYLCYTCSAKAEKEMFDEQFFKINSQPIKLSRSVCIYTSETDQDEDEAEELIMPTLKRCTAIDNCKDDPVILKKNDDLYVLDGLTKEIRSSITFKPVPNYRYNEITNRIEKIDPTIEEEDRRLIVLQRNPNAVLEEDYKKI
jgi:hypothetical protein